MPHAASSNDNASGFGITFRAGTATVSASVPGCFSDSSVRPGSRVSSPPPASGSPSTASRSTAPAMRSRWSHARRLAKDFGWTVKEDSGRGWRRVVPSPEPLRNGATIPLKNSQSFPTTERTLASIADPGPEVRADAAVEMVASPDREAVA